MKKTLSLLLLTTFLLSCGPKRMGCGARGICETSKKKSKLTSKFIPASYRYVDHDNLVNTEYRPILD
jgi:hypothetical protein